MQEIVNFSLTRSNSMLLSTIYVSFLNIVRTNFLKQKYEQKEGPPYCEMTVAAKDPPILLINEINSYTAIKKFMTSYMSVCSPLISLWPPQECAMHGKKFLDITEARAVS